MQNSRIVILIMIFALSMVASNDGAIAQTAHADYVDGQIWLKQSDTSQLVLDPYAGNNAQLNLLFGLYSVDTIYKAFVSNDTFVGRIFKLEFSDTFSVDTLISQLGILPFVDYVEKVPLLQTSITNYTPNDLDPMQWYLTKIDAPLAWDVTKGDQSVTIAIVDNAVRITHEDLVDNLWVNPGEIPGNLLDDDLNGYPDDVNGYDVADHDNDPNPPSGTTDQDPFVHGTHCAGIASASTDNGKGMAGLGFNVKIMAVKCTPNLTNGNIILNGYEGVEYAISAGADIISMSWGSKGTSITAQRVILLGQSQGVVMIAAAGNDNTSDVFYPAGYTEVLSVGSTNSIDQKSSFSNYGSWIDVMAPGSSIYSCLAGSDSSYGNLSGTSMACPLVAGLAGLVVSVDPQASKADVENSIKNGCLDIDLINPTYAGQLGSGRINAFATVNSVIGSSRDEPNMADVVRAELWPNPSSGEFQISIDLDVLEIDWQLIDLSGRQIAAGRQERPGMAESFKFDISDSEYKGLSILKVQGGDSHLTFRIVTF